MLEWRNMKTYLCLKPNQDTCQTSKHLHIDYMNIKLKHKHGFKFIFISNKNMADAQTCKVEEILAH
jgi:hypothetical protein